MWPFRKRAFSVSGRFRQLLSDLIWDMHNSNRQLRQSTLEGGILVQEYRFYVLGFVPADVVRLKIDVWFRKLDSKRGALVDWFFAGMHAFLELADYVNFDFNPI